MVRKQSCQLTQVAGESVLPVPRPRPQAALWALASVSSLPGGSRSLEDELFSADTGALGRRSLQQELCSVCVRVRVQQHTPGWRCPWSSRGDKHASGSSAGNTHRTQAGSCRPETNTTPASVLRKPHSCRESVTSDSGGSRWREAAVSSSEVIDRNPMARDLQAR